MADPTVTQPSAKPAPPAAAADPANGPILRGAWLCVGGIALLSVLALRIEGRLWWCACRTPTPFSTRVASSHNSQHLLDPYSFSHLLHGIIFYWALRLLLPRARVATLLLIALLIEAGWEVLENSPIIIARYRAATASLGYSGDTIVNSVGDILSCLLGFFLAQRVGWKWSIALFIAIELIMLGLIRDNLTLNVIMLLWPIEAIKQWQGGG
jgi:hypothetical protein